MLHKKWHVWLLFVVMVIIMGLLRELQLLFVVMVVIWRVGDVDGGGVALSVLGYGNDTVELYCQVSMQLH